eukprot:652375-Amorphochlora_amoeboformis.AAC.1
MKRHYDRRRKKTREKVGKKRENALVKTGMSPEAPVSMGIEIPLCSYSQNPTETLIHAVECPVSHFHRIGRTDLSVSFFSCLLAFKARFKPTTNRYSTIQGQK